MSISLPQKPEGQQSWDNGSSPEAIQACVASLAAEAFELGHPRAASLLAQASALLATADLWNDPRHAVAPWKGPRAAE